MKLSWYPRFEFHRKSPAQCCLRRTDEVSIRLHAGKNAMTSTFYSRLGKRWFDAIASFVGLLLLSPFFILVALVVRLSSPGPAFFSQIRMGQFEKPFRIFKFRTMKRAPCSSDSLLTSAGDSRITSLGCWLRKTKIDELPQLVNVLAGQMSFVGPRPEVPLYTSRYSEAQRKVFTAKPGITGSSIIVNEEQLIASQPNKERFYLTTILPAKLQVDLDYCANIRFRNDLRLLLLTLARLLRRNASKPLPAGCIEHLAAISHGGVNPNLQPTRR
jgi:lipopolysaccharide/colanic/teichoic acid biosynthesis glycosyltransferase